MIALNFSSAECMKQHFFGEPVGNPNCQYIYPGYASNIIFELHENDEKKGQFYVQTFFNGTAIPICGHEDGTCEFT